MFLLDKNGTFRCHSGQEWSSTTLTGIESRQRKDKNFQNMRQPRIFQVYTEFFLKILQARKWRNQEFFLCEIPEVAFWWDIQSHEKYLSPKIPQSPNLKKSQIARKNPRYRKITDIKKFSRHENSGTEKSSFLELKFRGFYMGKISNPHEWKIPISNPRDFKSPGIFWSTPKWKIPISDSRDLDKF